MRRPSLRTAAAALALAVFAALPAGAQAVHGTLVDPAGKPVEQVLVALVDGTGRQAGAALTTAGGEFTVRAPGAGRYSLRVERVGFSTVTSPAFDLGAAETREERLVASGRAVMLEGLVITPGARRCAVRPGAGAATATLWEEARKALAAAEFTSRAGLFRYDVVRWERDLALGSGAVTRDQRQTRTGVAELPFVSVPPEELTRFGFIRQMPGDSMIYAAPDARVLLSDEFLDLHCFRVAEGGEPGLVGLEFEPVRGRGVPDVHGVLWLDRATAELRRVEYRYVNGPPESREPRVGGSVEFERLSGGPWIVRRWAIRMPVAELTRRGMTVSGATPVSQDLRLVGVHEAGGEVTGAALASGSARGVSVARAAAAPAVVEGVVWDSTARAPLAGARVFLSGTAAEAVTGADGRYRLVAPAAGSYTVALSAPELGPVAAAVLPRTVAAVAGEATRADLAVPGAARVAASLCPAAALRIHRGMVTGRVRGVTPDSVAVRASWQRVSVSAGTIQGSSSFTETRPDAAGYYVLCGVPEGVPVEVAVRAARQDRRRSASDPVDPRAVSLRAAGREESRVEVSVSSGVPLRLDVGPGAPDRETSGRRPE